MREHPIPQDITGYRFHIIGSMTLKQFAEITLGVIVAFLIYKSNLLFPVKWLLIIVSAGLGAGAAFLPIAGRPLDHWIITFFSVLYKPTKFYWNRTVKVPETFSYKPDPNRQPMEEELDLSPARRQRVKEYLESVNQVEEIAPDIDPTEQARLQHILEAFAFQPITDTQVVIQKEAEKPELSVRVRKLKNNQPITVYKNQQAEPDTVPGYGNTSQFDLLQREQQAQQHQKTMLATEQVAQNINIPKVRGIDVADTALEEEDQMAPIQATGQQAYLESPLLQTPTNVATSDAAFNVELPFPEMPSEPNKIVGMVLSPQNELITDAIVEIRTLDGNIARAVKTNALGQFFISTPLKDGDYTLVVEKDSYRFDPQGLTLTGHLVEPIEIRSATS